MKIMSGFDMLEEAKDGRNELMFLDGQVCTGAPWESRFVKVDLELDRQVPDNGIVISVDLDSLIWVTRNPRFLQAIQVYTSAVPPQNNRPPLAKHNHVYVDLLVPQSDDDREASQFCTLEEGGK